MVLKRAPAGTVYSFGVYELDVDAGELRKRGVRIRLQTQPMRVLTLLLANAGVVVEREALQAELWPDDTFVDFDHGLNSAVNKIRQALSDTAANPRFLETEPRKGYRFLAEVQAKGGVAAPPVEARPEGAAVTEASPKVVRERDDPEAPRPAPTVSVPTRPALETAPDTGSEAAGAKERPRVVLALGVSVLCALMWFAAVRFAGNSIERQAAAEEAATTGGPVRILAGQIGSHAARDGTIWEGDQYFRGGTGERREGAVFGTEDRLPFQGERYGAFLYSVPLERKIYRVRLYFSENWFGAGNPAGGGSGSRRFDVLINGEAQLRDVDVFREAGGANRALVKTIEGVSPGPDGAIEIAFSPLVQNAMVNAIEITGE